MELIILPTFLNTKWIYTNNNSGELILKEEIEFLNYIYQNSKIAIEYIMRLLKTRNEGDEIEVILKEQLKGYKKILTSTEAMLERRKKKAQDITIFEKIGTYFNVKNIIDTDNIVSIAEMFIQGSKAGIAQIQKNLKDYNIENKNVVKIGNRMIE